MKRVNSAYIIQYLIDKYSYNTYVEIGVRDGRTLSKIRCKQKYGVDVRKGRYVTHHMSSDIFFVRLPTAKKFDIYYIDGMHTKAQVDKDITNCLKHLSDNGSIVLHDCNPPTKWHQRNYKEFMQGGARGAWNGTVWQSIVHLRTTRPDLSVCVIDDNWGMGVVRVGSQDLYVPEDISKRFNYEYFSKHRKEMLNLISFDDWVATIQ